MSRHTLIRSVASAALAALCAGGVLAQAANPPGGTAYPGTLTLQVDATDLDHRIFRVKQTVPVRPGPLTLAFPRWLPGNYAPNGRIAELAGLTMSAAGRTIAWRRDPLDVHAFHLEVPAGAASLEIEFRQLSPVAKASGRVC